VHRIFDNKLINDSIAYSEHPLTQTALSFSNYTNKTPLDESFGLIPIALISDQFILAKSFTLST